MVFEFIVDMEDSNNTKNWFSLLRSLRIRSHPTNNRSSEEDTVIFHRDIASYNNESSSNYPRKQSSLRRSLIKMQTRVKNAFKYKNTSRNNTVSSNPTSSSAQHRVTLDSTIRQTENIYYTLESSKPNLNPPQWEQNQVVTRFSDPMNMPCLENIKSSCSTTAPVAPPRIRKIVVQSPALQNGRVPKNEIANLSNYYWYWGPISRTQAEERLKDSPDGAFLVRDSLSERYLFTLSFRSVGKVLHTRIEFSDDGYSLADQMGYNSVADLVQDAIAKSLDSIYCYTKTKDNILPNFPVRLTLPISRYDKVPTLKYLSRFVIRQYVNINDMEKLPLPVCLVNYLQEGGQYF